LVLCLILKADGTGPQAQGDHLSGKPVREFCSVWGGVTLQASNIT